MTERDDRADIRDLLIRYASGIDRRDWALFRTVFTVDCVVDYGAIGAWTGIDELTEFMDSTHTMFGHTLHRMSNDAVVVAGDRASARSYVDALQMAPDGMTGVNGIGNYDDELVRAPDGWRIARRRFTTVRVAAVGKP